MILLWSLVTHLSHRFRLCFGAVNFFSFFFSLFNLLCLIAVVWGLCTTPHDFFLNFFFVSSSSTTNEANRVTNDSKVFSDVHSLVRSLYFDYVLAVCHLYIQQIVLFVWLFDGKASKKQQQQQPPTERREEEKKNERKM